MTNAIIMMNTPFDRHSIGSSRHSRRRRSSSALEVLQAMDLKILRSCNELMEARTESAKQRAQQTTDRFKLQRDWEQVHRTWQQRLKPPKKAGGGTGQELYHEAVGEAFRRKSSNTKKNEAKEPKTNDNDNDDETDVVPSVVAEDLGMNQKTNEKDDNDNDDDDHDHDHDDEPADEPSMSPFLQARLASLCQLIHLMTLGEAQIQKIHNDSRAVVNWLHEEWERMERETNGMKQQIQRIQAQRETLDMVAEQYKRLDDDDDDDMDR